MLTKPLISGEPLVEIERKRYDELLHTEAKYQVIAKAISRAYSYNDIAAIIKIFELEERKIQENENE